MEEIKNETVEVIEEKEKIPAKERVKRFWKKSGKWVMLAASVAAGMAGAAVVRKRNSSAEDDPDTDGEESCDETCDENTDEE